MTLRSRMFVTMLALLLALPMLACGGLSATTSRSPRWACPSPTPLPYGIDGPVKEQIALPTMTPTGPQEYQTTYYDIWEQEYGDLGGPPFPAPTPYGLLGTSYVFGQRVEIWPFHLLVDAVAGPLVELPGTPAGSRQLYLIDMTWVNSIDDDVPFRYAERVRLRAITEPSGALVSDSRWGVTAQALHLAGITALPEVIPPGTSQVRVPILAPPGIPEVVEVIFDADPAYQPQLPGTPAVATPTPLPNDDLRVTTPDILTVQWSNARWNAPGAPPCDDPGVLTDWDDGSGAWGRRATLAVAAPPGADRLIQIVLNQVGKRYVWGAKGPETFDCSGLAAWSYAQIGIAIPEGTGGQWPHLRPVSQAEVQPGDLVFFDIAGRGRIDHVGMLVGDLDGDGHWDMVHAASPQLGVRIEYGVFESAVYASRIRGFRTAR